MATHAAADEDEIWSRNITPSWLDEHLAAKRATRARPAPRLSRTQVWAYGLSRSDMQAFLPTDFDRAVGAKLQPFQDYNFLVGTELVRSGSESSLVSSRATWEAFLERDWQTLGVSAGLSTAGFVDSVQNAYTQSISGSMDIPFDIPLQTWTTQLRLSPSMNLDSMNGVVGTGLLSEIIGRTRLSSRADRFTSDLNVRLGYGVAPDTRPTASARLELRIAPNL
ncbi:hypothetical protein [Microvirga calopogonii]|uniref:hypothetical protein n=1 Tax=Microvirga calopogonii TaxID=2078013 RepID=UPI0013B41873|nr:hypothetical protein [Microvirga calopogonii]